MNFQAIFLAILFGLSSPIIADVSENIQAIANPPFPSGDFGDDTWLITLWYKNNVHHYHGWNLKTGDTIDLSGVKISGNRQRWVYTWDNNGYQYQVAWQPSDPDYIRLQVIGPKGKTVLNRLLTKRKQGVGG